MGIYVSPQHLYISMAFIYLPGIYISPSVFIYFTGHLYKSMGIYILLLVFTNTHFYPIMRHMAPHNIRPISTIRTTVRTICLGHYVLSARGKGHLNDNVKMLLGQKEKLEK